MKNVMRRGQATAEFSLVILAFVIILFGAIEVARAISEKDTLSRAAETIAHELAYTDPNLNPLFSMDSSDPTSQTFINQAITDANKNAALNLTAPTYTSIPVTTITAGYYNSDPNSNDCSAASSSGTPACESVTSADGSVVIVGFPYLSTHQTTELRVTVCKPFTSVIGHFAFPSRRDGKACETVTATTFHGQGLDG
jgi:Flp pilus assembly protein TadG